MTMPGSKWQLTDSITEPHQIEERVCNALDAHVVRYRNGDIPFINGYRIGLFAMPEFTWNASNWGIVETPLARMGDVADTYFLCALTNHNWLNIETWDYVSRACREKRYHPQSNHWRVETWRDVVQTIENIFIKNQPAAIVPWGHAQLNQRLGRR